MKKFLLIIGVVAIGLWFNPTAVHAQDAGPEDCKRTLYENEFICQKEKTYSYCSALAQADQEKDPSQLTFYNNIYCNITRDTDDEIYEILAEQFVAEDPDFDAEKIKNILLGLSETGDLEEDIYSRVKTAYDNEKIIHQSKASLKQEFKNHEMWANGTLSDSPFDLIVDLNLIEIVLFGSRAQWVDDIYYFPEEEKEEAEEVPPEEEAEEIPPEEEAEEIPPEAEEYECVPEEIPPQREIPINCGNGELDADEECDDGNNWAGDGCSEICLLEIWASPTCWDIEAVTFKQFSPPLVPVSEEEAEEEEIPITCPPGTTPVKKPLPQSPNYPGPFKGGVLKNFLPSKRPDCPAGWSPFEIKIAGVTETADLKRCIPLKFCADPDDFRDFLYTVSMPSFVMMIPAGTVLPPDWRDLPGGHVVRQFIEAIEAVICVEFKKFMRPESPYSLDEGCIDCHISAMNDVMDKMLGKNVAPLQNNMQAWGLSNRWGPNFTFDIVTSVKSLLKRKFTKTTTLTQQEKTNLYMQDLLQEKQLDPNKEPHPTEAYAVEIIEREVGKNIEAEEVLYRGLENYRSVGNIETVSQQTGKALGSLLEQMRQSFSRLQDKYMGLALTLALHEKKECNF